MGTDLLLKIGSIVLLLGGLIFIHELGHFIAAKLLNVKVVRFSIGFGPSLLRKRWGETEYILALLPLGGYVRMASRLDEDAAFLEGGSEKAPRTADPDFGHRTRAFSERNIIASGWSSMRVRTSSM